MSESPRLSVIIPFHDCAASIRAILDDLHSQQIAMEIIAVDDASTDGGPAIVTDWAHSHPEYPVRIIHSRHRIYSLGARLEGMRQAAAPVILSLDADDRLLGTQRLRRALHMMEETNCDILHFRTAGIPTPILPRGKATAATFWEQQHRAHSSNSIFTGRRMVLCTRTPTIRSRAMPLPEQRTDRRPPVTSSFSPGKAIQQKLRKNWSMPTSASLNLNVYGEF